MVTLYAYILRELLKMFGLTVLALTALFAMGGGIFNVMTQEGISTADVLRFLPMLIPIIVTLTMPMAALFAATIVYGRLAADNEFVACRSAGINIHRLFLPVVLLSVFVALFTTASANFVIPGFMKTINHFARKNLGEIAAAKLKTDGNVRFERNKRQFLMTAEGAGIISTADMRARNDRLPETEQFELSPDISYLAVREPTFLQFNGEQLVRYVNAAWGLCQFDTRADTDFVKVTLVVGEFQDIDLAGNTVTHLRKQPIELLVPIPLPNSPAWADLTTLIRWLRQPWLYDGENVGGSIDKFIDAIAPFRFAAYCTQRLNDNGGKLVLSDSSGATYDIRSQTHETRMDGRLDLAGVEVLLTKRGLQRPIRYVTDRAELIARPLGHRDTMVELRLIGSALEPLLEYNPRAKDYTKPIEKTTLSLDGLLPPQAVKTALLGITRRSVVDPSVALDLNDDMLNIRVKLQRAVGAFRRKVAALIHFRLGFSSSALVTILMGAVLGVIFRGARALAAFGLASVPFAIVGIMMLMGRQLAEHGGTESVGRAIIWGGLLAVAAADVLILRIGVRR